MGSNERSTYLKLRDGNNNILLSIKLTGGNDAKVFSLLIHGCSHTTPLLVPRKRFQNLLFKEIISTLEGFLRVQERRSLNYKARQTNDETTIHCEFTFFQANDLFCGKTANSGIKWKQSNHPPLSIET